MRKNMFLTKVDCYRSFEALMHTQGLDFVYTFAIKRKHDFV